MSTHQKSQDLTPIEIKLAYMEQSLEDMSGVVYQQQQEIDLLKKQVSVLGKKLKQAKDLIPELGDLLENQKPPHY